MSLNDTIAAVSTPMGAGGIGIIRICGEQAFEITARLFKGRRPFGEVKSHTLSYGKLVNPQNRETVDEVLVSKMMKPNTFTKEDTVEINCHGGPVVMRDILRLVVAEGARPAEPGEFTKRAFLNGRIDLSQAEAVIDLINAKTGEGSKAAIEQLEGRLSEKIRSARKVLVTLIAHIEVTVDYPEHDIEEITGKKVYEEARELCKTLEHIAEGFDRGRIIREGINAVIIGKPNVGKSSLLNELSGKNRSIVTDIPGTTRDIIEEYVSVRGIPVKIFDTAGIRHTTDPIEKIGVERAEKAIENADLVIMVLDAASGTDEEDLRILKNISGKKTIYIINKTDLIEGRKAASLPELPDRAAVIEASMLQGKGVTELEDEIEKLFLRGGISINNEVLVTNIRHKQLLDKAIYNLQEACKAYEAGMPLDMITIDIRSTAEFLGQITGESVSEEVVQEIFSRFCIGK